eukprot:NODE_298_length_1944_cov_81.060158_g209_i0.p1 GENE.NODE_298_length_1944_cov_81.060158_g209_i0~~NODE_298_length_1944_cov_81.060158_g209_i0.p1  ORF type:complete len:544 (-),score=152.94 NODE_298_length_1944_cov_81.060158_g209_i0:313-1875(-)
MWSAICLVLMLVEGSHGGTGVVLLTRSDTPTAAYNPLLAEIQALPNTYTAVTGSVAMLPTTVTKLKAMHNITDLFLMGHSMTGGGMDLQHYVAANPTTARGLILLAGFLQRSYRPDIPRCLAKASIKPHKSIKCPLGCLEDGVHDCQGPNMVSFPIPTLTVGGELDGVVRVTRIAEAFYTQAVLTKNKNMPVVVLPGANHASLLDSSSSLPSGVAARDLTGEMGPAAARKAVASLVQQFVHQVTMKGRPVPSSSAFFAPIIDAFVGQEGSWWFTGGDEEHGSSQWAATAQQWMAEPLPTTYRWKLANEFRLLSDEEKIPPYYRHKHRTTVNQTAGGLTGDTITQLRYIRLTVEQVDVGLNGNQIIREEKLGVLQELEDTGADFVSAIEIATKLESRQKVFNTTGAPSPPSLDDGDRCKAINQKAYDWALGRVPTSTQRRFQASGLPMKMMPDKKPTPPAGPWWIWNYLHNTTTSSGLEISSWYAFYSLSSDPYGAGNHYCKLLSPARAMEWVMVDGLRKH